MNLNTKFIIYNNYERYYEGTYENFKDTPLEFYTIKWKGDYPEGYKNNQLFDFIIEKVIRPENSMKCEGDFKCYCIYHYKCNFENAEIIKNYLVVFVEEAEMLNFKTMSLIELTQELIQCENDKENKNYHSEEEYRQLRSRIHFIKVELEKKEQKKMTTKKILEYLEARLRYLIRTEPDKFEYIDDKEYKFDTTAWDAKVCQLEDLIDDIKQYDTDEDVKVYVNGVIKKYE